MRLSSLPSRYLPAGAMLLLVSGLSLLPADVFRLVEPVAPAWRGADKLVHAVMYGVFSAALYYALPSAYRVRRVTMIGVTALAGGYGVVMEYCQAWLTSSRAADSLDALANTLGALSAALIAYGWCRRRT